MKPYLHSPPPLLPRPKPLRRPPVAHRVVEPVGRTDAGLQGEVVVLPLAGRGPAEAVDPEADLRHLLGPHHHLQALAVPRIGEGHPPGCADVAEGLDRPAAVLGKHETVVRPADPSGPT